MCVRYRSVPGDRLLGLTLRLNSVLSHRLALIPHALDQRLVYERL